MAILKGQVVVSGGALIGLKQAGPFPLRATPSSLQGQPLQLAYGSGDHATFLRMFEVQSEVRSVVSYLARSAAAVKIRVFRRSGENRERLYGHPMAHLLESPFPGSDYYRWAEQVFVDFLVLGEMAFLKGRDASGNIVALLPISPSRLTVHGTESFPRSYDYTGMSGEQVTGLTPADLVFATEYDPTNPLRGGSKLNALRDLLNAEAAAVSSRSAFWRNGARPAGVIEVDKDTEYTQVQRETFARAFASQFSGSEKAGRVAMLEAGLTYRQLAAVSAQDSQYIESRKLSRQEVGAAYGVPHDLVGGGTPSKGSLDFFIRETLVPFLRRWEGILSYKLLRDLDSDPAVYVKANIDSKLQGAFLDSSDVLRRATGKPIMTVNEARAKLDLPRHDSPESDQLPTPLFLGSEATSGGPDGGRLPIERPNSD